MKALLLGDLLTFLESYINKIVKKINSDYVLEFVGYEKDNPNTVADLDEKEVRTWKSINEKRAEKGLDPIDLSKIGNGADLPMNAQLIQMFQAAQAQLGMGDMGEEESEDNDDWQNYGDEEGSNEESNNDYSGLEDSKNTNAYSGLEESSEDINKSLLRI